MPSVNKSPLPKLLHVYVDICKHTEKCILQSYSRLKGIYPANFLGPTNLALFMLSIHRTANNDNSPTINYKNAFGIMNLNFIIRRPMYVRTFSYLDKNNFRFFLSTVSFDQQIALVLFSGSQCFTEFNILYIFSLVSFSPQVLLKATLTILCIYFQKFL